MKMGKYFRKVVRIGKLARSRNCRATYKHCTHPDTETRNRFRATAMLRQDRFRGTNIQKARNSQTMQQTQAVVQVLAKENKRLWRAIKRVQEEKDEVIREMERKLFVVEQEREEKDEKINLLEHRNYVESVCGELIARTGGR